MSRAIEFPRPWRRLCRRFLGPLLPDTGERAASWLGRRNKLQIGFTTILERREKAIYLRQDGKLLKGWSDPATSRPSVSITHGTETA